MGNRSVGSDVHKTTVCVAVAESGRDGEVRQVEILRKLAARLGKSDRRLSSFWGASPCGYGLNRLLTACGQFQWLSQFATLCRRPRSARQLRPARPSRHPPVDPLKQHRELCSAQHNHALLSPRPYASATFQAFAEQAWPVTIPP
jgi:hypothetical protein